MFKKRIKKEKEPCFIAALLSERLWDMATKTYEGKEFKIELSNLVFCVWLFDEKKLQKQFLYSKQKISKIAQTLQIDDAVTVEKNNRDLANYINQTLHEYLQLKLPKRKSFIEQLKNNPLAQNYSC